MTSLDHLTDPDITKELRIGAHQLHRRWSTSASLSLEECTSAVNEAAVDLCLRHDPDKGRTLSSYLSAYLQMEAAHKLEAWGLIAPRRCVKPTKEPLPDGWQEELPSPPPLREVEANEVLDWIRSCPALSAMQRAVLYQRCALPSSEGEKPPSWKETAETLGITVNAVRENARAARKLLHAWAKENGFSPVYRHPAYRRPELADA